MDAHVRLVATPGVIDSITDFAYRWSINSGLRKDDALHLTLALDELVTDIVRFAFPQAEGELQISFNHAMNNVEIVIHELGEPFDPDRHLYDREKALNNGDFEGAGLEIVKKMVDNFVFINKGREGKEFRLKKNIVSKHISEIMREEGIEETPEPEPQEVYDLFELTIDDVEDVSKLIYRTYGYSYVKGDLYFPKKNEWALLRGDKYGVIIRTPDGNAVAYFAVILSTDSKIGEVGEAVVSLEHRRRGLMTRMMHALIKKSKEMELWALYGEAITVHTISQKVNHKFGFKTTALLLAATTAAKYKGIDEQYPQHVSEVIDLLILRPVKQRHLYLPDEYKIILTKIYNHLGIDVVDLQVDQLTLPEKANVELDINYDDRTALIIVDEFGINFLELLGDMLETLTQEIVNAVYLDLPLHKPGTKEMVPFLNNMEFIFSGLAPLMHHEKDYLRLQRIFEPVDLSLVHVYSKMATFIKTIIQEELSEIRKVKA